MSDETLVLEHDGPVKVVVGSSRPGLGLLRLSPRRVSDSAEVLIELDGRSFSRPEIRIVAPPARIANKGALSVDVVSGLGITVNTPGETAIRPLDLTDVSGVVVRFDGVGGRDSESASMLTIRGGNLTLYTNISEDNSTRRESTWTSYSLQLDQQPAPEGGTPSGVPTGVKAPPSYLQLSDIANQKWFLWVASNGVARLSRVGPTDVRFERFLGVPLNAEPADLEERRQDWYPGMPLPTPEFPRRRFP